MGRLKKWLGLGCAFILGVASMVAFAIIFHTTLPWNDPSTIAERWAFIEDSPGHLVIGLPGPPMMSVDIKRDPDSKALKSIMVGKEEVGFVFEYRSQGEFGAASAEYNGGPIGEGMTWRDLNADGVFDKRFDYGNARMEILVSGEWVAAKMPDSVAETDDGRKFEFDLKSGKWQAVAPTANK